MPLTTALATVDNLSRRNRESLHPPGCLFPKLPRLWDASGAGPHAPGQQCPLLPPLDLVMGFLGCATTVSAYDEASRGHRREGPLASPQGWLLQWPSHSKTAMTRQKGLEQMGHTQKKVLGQVQDRNQVVTTQEVPAFRRGAAGVLFVPLSSLSPVSVSPSLPPTQNHFLTRRNAHSCTQSHT